MLVAVVATAHKRVYADAAARHEHSAHFDVARVHKLPQVVEDDVDAVFVEVAVVAE